MTKGGSMARVRNDDKTQKEKRIFIVQCMVSVCFLRRLERVEANPTLDMIEKLAKFVGMTPAAFLFPPTPASDE